MDSAARLYLPSVTDAAINNSKPPPGRKTGVRCSHPTYSFYICGLVTACHYPAVVWRSLSARNTKKNCTLTCIYKHTHVRTVNKAGCSEHRWQVGTAIKHSTQHKSSTCGIIMVKCSQPDAETIINSLSLRRVVWLLLLLLLSPVRLHPAHRTR